MTDTVHDNPARHRFELDANGDIAFAAYRRDGDILTVNHTEVPIRLRGQGVGARLVKGVLDIARAEGLTVVPRCSFVSAYIQRHPAYADLLGQPFEKRPAH